MQIELKVPPVGESITEVEIGQWLKSEGDTVAANDNLVSIESEKTTLELPAPASGALEKIIKRKGEVAKVGEVIGILQQDGAGAPKVPKRTESAKTESQPPQERKDAQEQPEQRVMPAAARIISEQGLKADSIQGTGPGGRVLKEDVLKHTEGLQKEKAAPA